MMRFWVSLLLLPGCIYLGERNHAPEGEVVVEPRATEFKRCETITLMADARDTADQPERLLYRWWVGVKSEEKWPDHNPGWSDDNLQLLRADAPATCPDLDPKAVLVDVAAGPRLLGNGPELTLSHLPARGQYTAHLEIQDTLGAVRKLTFDFVVKNQPPTFADNALRFVADPEVKTYSVPDRNDKYPGHAEYLAWITSFSDPDDVLGCDRNLLWEPIGFTPQEFVYLQEVCNSQFPHGALRFRLPRDAVLAPRDLGFRVTLKDLQGGSAVVEERLPVVPNRPPCLLSTEPYHDHLLKVPASQASVFGAPFVSDDVPEPLEFTWSVKDQGAAAFSSIAVQSGVAQPALTLPAWFRLPGDRLQLRLSLRELSGSEPTCPETEARCLCPGLTECYRWVTWDVEFF